jgi:hypothetical protein
MYLLNQLGKDRNRRRRRFGHCGQQLTLAGVQMRDDYLLRAERVVRSEQQRYDDRSAAVASATILG